MKRRSFLKTVAMGAGVLAHQASAARSLAAVEDQQESVAGMPRRLLGRTGQRVSIIGYPGFALREQERSQADCTAALARALENGVNYFDVAPAYADGLCEERMGIGFSEIKEYQRDSVFLACKTRDRTKDGAQMELDRSLKRLKTEYFDLYQLHCLIKTDEDVDAAFGPNGAMETVLKAREQGKIRYIGFSAHSTKAALAAMQKHRFDTVMFPINFVELFTLGIGRQVLELAQQQGAGVMAIKTLSDGNWPEEIAWNDRPRKWWYRTMETPDEIDLAVRFTLSQPAVVAGIPPAFIDLADKAIAAGKRFRPITDEETEQLRTRSAIRASLFQQWEQLARLHGRGHRHITAPTGGCPGMMS